MMVQDDACFYDRENLRDYLERVLWPCDPPGLISLYCSSAYTNELSGWHQIDNEWVWGALAFVFPRKRLRQFLTDTQVIAHRWKSNGLRLIDEGDWKMGPARRGPHPLPHAEPRSAPRNHQYHLARRPFHRLPPSRLVCGQQRVIIEAARFLRSRPPLHHRCVLPMLATHPP